MRQRRRYKQIRNNPRFKRKKKIYRKFRTRHRRLAGFRVQSDEQIPIDRAVEFVMKCGGSIKAGYVTGVVADTWQIEYLLEDGEIGSLAPERFFDCAIMFDEQDIDVIFDLLDEASRTPDDGDDTVIVYEFADPTPEPVDESTKRVAGIYLSFNKENPGDLMSQLVKVLDKGANQAEGEGRKKLKDVSSRVKGLAKNVAKAWESRHEE